MILGAALFKDIAS